MRRRGLKAPLISSAKALRHPKTRHPKIIPTKIVRLQAARILSTKINRDLTKTLPAPNHASFRASLRSA
jgi:hypothetical protein